MYHILAGPGNIYVANRHPLTLIKLHGNSQFTQLSPSLLCELLTPKEHVIHLYVLSTEHMYVVGAWFVLAYEQLIRQEGSHCNRTMELSLSRR